MILPKTLVETTTVVVASVSDRVVLDVAAYNPRPRRQTRHASRRRGGIKGSHEISLTRVLRISRRRVRRVRMSHPPAALFLDTVFLCFIGVARPDQLCRVTHRRHSIKRRRRADESPIYEYPVSAGFTRPARRRSLKTYDARACAVRFDLDVTRSIVGFTFYRRDVGDPIVRGR